jgi:hypothetical protein
MASQSSIVGTISALTSLGGRISQQITDFLNHASDPLADLSDVSVELSELCSVLSKLEGSLRHNFNSIPPFPPGVTRDLTAVLNNCMKDLAHLQTVVQKFIEHENEGTLAAVWKNWRFLFADKDLAKIRDSLVAHKGTLNITLSLTSRYLTLPFRVSLHRS